MSVHKKVKANGDISYMVRFRAGGRNRQQTFPTKKLAEAFDGSLRMKKLTGDMAKIDAGKKTLAEFGEEWWDISKLEWATATRANYSNSWNKHIMPFLGEVPLREITPRVVEEWKADLTRNGRTNPTIKKTMNVLQLCLNKAVNWGEIQYNPVSGVKKPSGKRRKAIRPATPQTIELIRSHLLAEGKDRDATLVSVLAYAGLRPGEALALRWDHVRAKTLLIEDAVAYGEVKETKTSSIRSVPIMPALREDLEYWRLIGPKYPGGLIFPSDEHDGDPWHREAYKSWGQKAFKRAAIKAGREDLSPYGLRHSCASLLLRQGMSVVEVAQIMGHAPTMCLSTYAHVIAELDPDDRRPAAELVEEARREVAIHQKSEQSEPDSGSNVRHLFAGRPLPQRFAG